MRISSKSRHAISSMMELAVQQDNRALALSEIAEIHNISLSYLEQIFSELRAKGLVKGRRGPGGGYVLGRDRAEISITDIICAVDEWVDYIFNTPRTQTVAGQLQPSMVSWNELSRSIYDFLSGITLDSVQHSGLSPLEQWTDKAEMRKAA
jgi:Rrf2 family iron-sulfur cluster assembly transcriptional regulator